VEHQWQRLSAYQDEVANLVWRYCEIHVGKVIAFVMVWLCVSEVSRGETYIGTFIISLQQLLILGIYMNHQYNSKFFFFKCTYF
jgi:hypothetical protein